MSRMISLFPRSWRDRFGDEFEALLAAHPPSARDRLDIVLAAVDARIDPQVGVDRATRRVPTRGDVATGLVAVAAGIVLTTWVLVGLSVVRPWGSGPTTRPELESIVAALSLLGAVLAMVTLVATAFRHGERLGEAGTLGAAMASIALFVMPTGLFGILLLTIGITLFARSAAGVLVPTAAAILLVLATFGVGASMIGFGMSGGQAMGLLLPMFAFGPAWIVFGIGLLRGPLVELPPAATA